MKKQYVSILHVLACFLALSVGAEAQSRDEVVVTLPFEFVVAGTSLPAGTYTVRASETRSELLLSSYENQSSAFVISNQFESYPSDSPRLRFDLVGNVHFLSKIETANGVYSIPVRRTATIVARMMQHQAMSPAGRTKSTSQREAHGLYQHTIQGLLFSEDFVEH